MGMGKRIELRGLGIEMSRTALARIWSETEGVSGATNRPGKAGQCKASEWTGDDWTRTETEKHSVVKLC